MVKEAIKTVNLSKKYGKNLVVDDLNLSIESGEIVGFLGLNGAGKTTTMRMLLGLIKPTSGECYIQGNKVDQNNLEVLNEIGYIIETPYSYPDLTVQENLEIVSTLRGIRNKDVIDWVTEKLKLDQYKDKKVKHLSLGNVARLGIAKAIIHKPKILILDEPTNGLDPFGVIEVRELLKELANNLGTTVLISSHKLEEISKIATRIVIIHEGRLIREVESKELDLYLEKRLLVSGRNNKAMKEVDGLLVHISTDYVFGGDPYNTPCKEDQKGTPTGVYGLTKLHGEQKIQATGVKHIIIRTAWLYSEFGKNFVKTMLSLTAAKPQLKVVFDQCGTPTYAGDLADVILDIIENRKFDGNEGIYHFSNEGVCSWYDFTLAIAELTGNTTCEVLPCHSDEYPSPVVRPAYSVLDKTKIKHTFGYQIPYWRDSLKKCLANIGE